MKLYTKYQGSRPCGFRQEDFSMFVWPQEHTCNLKNLVEVHEVMLHTKYQGSRPCGFRQEDFFMFSIYKPMLNM